MFIWMQIRKIQLITFIRYNTFFLNQAAILIMMLIFFREIVKKKFLF